MSAELQHLFGLMNHVTGVILPRPLSRNDNPLNCIGCWSVSGMNIITVTSLRFLPALLFVLSKNAVACFQMFLTNIGMIVTFCISATSSVKSQYVNS